MNTNTLIRHIYLDACIPKQFDNSMYVFTCIAKNRHSELRDVNLLCQMLLHCVHNESERKLLLGRQLMKFNCRRYTGSLVVGEVYVWHGLTRDDNRLRSSAKHCAWARDDSDDCRYRTTITIISDVHGGVHDRVVPVELFA